MAQDDSWYPAPIAPELLAPVLAGLAHARTLPSQAYTSAEVLGWETEWFFARSWVCAGRSADLARAGDRRAVRVGSDGVLLVRGDDGALRGFFNACRHRGHELLACGTTAPGRVIRCPYHAWVYRLDGSLRAAPRFPELDPADPVREGLIPTRVAEWHGWVFVNASGDVSDLAEHVGNLDALLTPYQPGRLVPGATFEYVVQANWKLVVENYQECYHCPGIHPELCRVTPYDSGERYTPTGRWVGGDMDLADHAETMSLDGRSGGRPLPGLGAAARRRVVYVGLFPNLLVSLHPDYVMTHRIEPLAPDRTRIECQWLFDPEVAAAPAFDPAWAVDFWDLINRQDWRACESVQRGVASRGYRQGPLTAHEETVHEFLGMVARSYLTGSPGPPPSTGGSAACSGSSDPSVEGGIRGFVDGPAGAPPGSTRSASTGR